MQQFNVYYSKRSFAHKHINLNQCYIGNKNDVICRDLKGKDKVIYMPNDDKQNCPIVNQLLGQSIKPSDERIYETLGISLISSPMSPSSL